MKTTKGIDYPYFLCQGPVQTLYPFVVLWTNIGRRKFMSVFRAKRSCIEERCFSLNDYASLTKPRAASRISDHPEGYRRSRLVQHLWPLSPEIILLPVMAKSENMIDVNQCKDYILNLRRILLNYQLPHFYKSLRG